MNDIRVISPPMPGADALRLSAIIAVFKRNLRALMRVWRVAITWFVIEPAIVLLALALGIGRLVGNVEGGISYAEFVAPGIVIGTAMYHSLGEAAWAAFERINQGVYETMLTAPVTVREIVLAELCFAAFRAILSTIAVGGFAIAFGWIPLSAWPALFVVSVGVGLVFGGVGQLFAALSPSIHVLTMVFTVVATPMFFFSGSFFPISILPDWLEPVAWVTPLTPLVQLARGVSVGELGVVHVWCAAYVLVLAVVFYLLAARFMRQRLTR